MKWLACALVVIALCAGSFAGDLGWIPDQNADVWDELAGWALILFAAAVAFTPWPGSGPS